MRHIFGDWGYFGIFAIMALSNATIIIPAPGLFAVFAAGGAYDPLLIGIAGGLGAGLGELTGYLFGYGSAGIADAEKNRQYARVKGWMEKNGFLTVALLAAVPNPLFDIAGIAAGALKYKWWKFLIACALGAIAKSIVFAYFGHSLLS